MIILVISWWFASPGQPLKTGGRRAGCGPMLPSESRTTFELIFLRSINSSTIVFMFLNALSTAFQHLVNYFTYLLNIFALIISAILAE